MSWARLFVLNCEGLSSGSRRGAITLMINALVLRSSLISCPFFPLLADVVAGSWQGPFPWRWWTSRWPSWPGWTGRWLSLCLGGERRGEVLHLDLLVHACSFLLGLEFLDLPGWVPATTWLSVLGPGFEVEVEEDFLEELLAFGRCLKVNLQICASKSSAVVNLWLGRGSSMRRPGSKDPHGRQQNINKGNGLTILTIKALGKKDKPNQNHLICMYLHLWISFYMNYVRQVEIRLL